MKKPSIVRKKSKVNGQILVDIKQLPKRDPKLSFSESINNLQLKLFSKEITPSPVKNNSKQSILNINNETKNNNNNNSNNNNGLYQTIPEENDALLKKISRRNSLKQKKRKSLVENILLKRKNKGELDTIKEIVIADQNEKTITNNPKKRFKFKDDNEDGKRKKKINIIEELRKFDREQQIKMEEYIDNKRKKQNEIMNKNLKLYNHNNYENNKNSGNIKFVQRNDNKTISEEKTYESQEDQSINKNNNNEKGQNNDKNDNDKSGNNIDNNNNNSMNDKNCNTNIKDDFQKVKEKYFSKNIFTNKFPETEYKTKYLDNFLKNDSLVKNLFANYIDETKENKNLNNNNPNINNNTTTNNNKINNNLNKNLYNNIFENGQTQKENKIKRNNSTDLKLKNSNNILSTDITNNIIDSNNKSNNFEHSLNLNTYTIYTNMIYKKYNSDGHINNSYQMILNSIDDKLNNLNKYKNKSIFPDAKFNKASSTDKIRTISNLSFKISKNSFRDSSFKLRNINTIKNNNKYYRDIFDKFDKYNGFKMIDHLTISPYKNNYNFNNNYKFVRAINELNDSKKYIY